MATGMAMRKNPYLDVEMILSLFFLLIMTIAHNNLLKG